MFKTPLQIEPIGRRKFKQIAPLIYETMAGVVYESPTGRITDLASTWGIPIVAAKFDGLVPMAATLHDFLYDGIVSRKEADSVFYEAMKAENEWYGVEAVTDAERYAIWLGVSVGGVFAFRGIEDGYEKPIMSVNA